MEDSQPEVQSKSESANEKKREGNLTGKCLLRSSCLRNIRRELDALSRFIMAPGIAGLVVSHPLGRGFIVELKKHAPFHLDLLPDEADARVLCEGHGFSVVNFTDEPLLYIFVAESTKRKNPSAVRELNPA
jgi:hypothetical protein